MHWKRPDLCMSSLDKSYRESLKLLNFDKNFQRWLLIKLDFPSYQMFIEAYINISYKNTRVLACLKNIPEKRMKNPIFVYPGLSYADKKLKFVCKIVFFFEMLVWVLKWICGWKKKKQNKFGPISKLLGKNFVVATKKMLVIQFSFIEIVW